MCDLPPRLQAIVGVLEIIERRFPCELAEQSVRSQPRTEASQRLRPAEAASAQESDFWVEVLANRQVFEQRTIAVPTVLESPLVAHVVVAPAWRVCPCPPAGHIDVLKKRERAVEAVGLCRR